MTAQRELELCAYCDAMLPWPCTCPPADSVRYPLDADLRLALRTRRRRRPRAAGCGEPTTRTEGENP